jgi:hypothetical protein
MQKRRQTIILSFCAFFIFYILSMRPFGCAASSCFCGSLFCSFGESFDRESSPNPREQKNRNSFFMIFPELTQHYTAPGYWSRFLLIRPVPTRFFSVPPILQSWQKYHLALTKKCTYVCLGVDSTRVIAREKQRDQLGGGRRNASKKREWNRPLSTCSEERITIKLL